MKLNEKIFCCRRKAGLSQESLAEKIGVSRQAISKWETGEASPEISKLPLLAKTFGVTTDWLLSEEDSPTAEPEQKESADLQPARGPHPYAPAGAPPVSSLPDWVEHLPGFLGRMLKKYGWLFGVRIAVSGALFMAMGFVAWAMFGSMNSIATDTFGFIGDVTAYDSAGNVMDLGKYGLSASDFGGLSGPMNSSISMVSRMTAPADILIGFILVLGLLMLIGGGALAWYLKKKGSET